MRGTGTADIRRLQRPYFPEGPESLAIAAGLAAAARCGGRKIRAAPSLDRLGPATGRLRFQTPEGERVVEARATVLALGGASWPRLGSDGGWVETLRAKGVKVSPLKPANCGFTVAWSDVFRDRFEGPRSRGSRCRSVGTAFAAKRLLPATASKAVRFTRCQPSCATLFSRRAELRFTSPCGRMSIQAISIARLSAPRGKQTLSNWLRKAAQLSPVAIGLLQETAIVSGIALASMSPDALAALINAVPVRPHGHRFDRARASRARAASHSTTSTPISCSAVCLAYSRRAKCSTGKPQPAATCCRPVLRRVRRRERER